MSIAMADPFSNLRVSIANATNLQTGAQQDKLKKTS